MALPLPAATNCYCFLSQWQGLISTSSIHAEVLIGLISGRSCTENHRCCEVMTQQLCRTQKMKMLVLLRPSKLAIISFIRSIIIKSLDPSVCGLDGSVILLYYHHHPTRFIPHAASVRMNMNIANSPRQPKRWLMSDAGHDVSSLSFLY